MNFENRWVLRSALNFASDGEVVREVGGEFQRTGPEKAKADLAKECLTRVKKKREEDRKPGRLEIRREPRETRISNIKRMMQQSQENSMVNSIKSRGKVKSKKKSKITIVTREKDIIVCR
ncbi:hypothetical protein HELRODRAFT_162346 [Helobdella robusta]|uniref:Uncharacterized protein n=1 Tax=Helobdella robusta TaxID=6412 RepID=T1ESJ2_HELRO|nr:hypothetical protein HELRODRAFT_162346 [Helobdella robusta]ESN98882.1 hypothetical protein HELRODRAFT_162346 [Helobdella robusta]